MCILFFVAAYFFMGGFVGTFISTPRIWMVLFWPLIVLILAGEITSRLLATLVFKIFSKYVEKNVNYEINLNKDNKHE